MQKIVFNTEFLGKHFIYLESVDSTNDYLSALVSEKLPEGTTVFSELQHKGKGQANAVWKSQACQNVLVSILFYPTFLKPQNQFIFNQTISLGVYDFAKTHLGDAIKIKWPNDLFYGEDKLAGILIETSIQYDKVNSAVVGIGLNVNQTEFSKDLLNPTSFKKIKGKHFDRIQLLKDLLKSLEFYYLKLKNGEIDFIKEKYLKALLGYQEERKFKIQNSEKAFSGIILGTNPNGKLILNIEDKIQEFFNKEIIFLS